MSLRTQPLTVPEQIQDIYEKLRKLHPPTNVLQLIQNAIDNNPCDCGCTTLPGSKSFFEAGIIGIEASNEIWYPPFPLTIRSIRATVKTSTGENIIDINVNGTTIFTDQTHRPTIPNASFTALATGIDLPTMLLGDYLNFDVDEGHGSDLSIEIGYVVECDALGVPTMGTGSPPKAACLNGAILGDAPIRYWRLDEPSGTAMVDAMGNQNGVYRNSPTLGVTGLVPCDADTAVGFASAGGNYADVADTVSTRLGTFSIEFLFKTTISPSNPQALVQSYANTTASGNLRAAAVLIDGSSKLTFECFDNTGLHGGRGILAQDTAGLSANTVYHVVATCTSGGQIILYKNGVQVAATSIGTPDVAAAIQWVMAYDPGISGGGHVADLDGVMDEIAIYDYALSAAQVAAHFAITGL